MRLGWLVFFASAFGGMALAAPTCQDRDLRAVLEHAKISREYFVAQEKSYREMNQGMAQDRGFSGALLVHSAGGAKEVLRALQMPTEGPRNMTLQRLVKASLNEESGFAAFKSDRPTYSNSLNHLAKLDETARLKLAELNTLTDDGWNLPPKNDPVYAKSFLRSLAIQNEGKRLVSEISAGLFLEAQDIVIARCKKL